MPPPKKILYVLSCKKMGYWNDTINKKRLGYDGRGRHMPLIVVSPVILRKFGSFHRHGHKFFLSSLARLNVTRNDFVAGLPKGKHTRETPERDLSVTDFSPFSLFCIVVLVLHTLPSRLCK